MSTAQPPAPTPAPSPSPVEALPTWCAKHGATINPRIKAMPVPGRGTGWVIAHQEGISQFENDSPLLTIPNKLVLSAQYVQRYAMHEENLPFAQLLQALGPEFQKDSRRVICLFMMLAPLKPSPSDPFNLEEPESESPEQDPWIQYMSLQPSSVSLPTTWSDPEVALLRGTSLESVLLAKGGLLASEFANILSKAQQIPFWSELLNFKNLQERWTWVDALFRSRSFDLPILGASMVPCLDFANHSRNSTALFQYDFLNDTIILVPRPSCANQLKPNEEVTISYGNDKPAAEMLFNYGFIDTEMPILVQYNLGPGTDSDLHHHCNRQQRSPSGKQSIVLPLDDLLPQEYKAQDRHYNAKLQIFNTAPTLELSTDEKGNPQWSAPFLYLLCIHEDDDSITFIHEDNTKFDDNNHTDSKTTAGDYNMNFNKWRIFFRNKDTTHIAASGADNTDTVSLSVFLNARDKALHDKLHRRAVSVMIRLVERQIQKIREAENKDDRILETGPQEKTGNIRDYIIQTVRQLRGVERVILERSFVALEREQHEISLRSLNK